jgi:hypothetical protein
MQLHAILIRGLSILEPILCGTKERLYILSEVFIPLFFVTLRFELKALFLLGQVFYCLSYTPPIPFSFLLFFR